MGLGPHSPPAPELVLLCLIHWIFQNHRGQQQGKIQEVKRDSGDLLVGFCQCETNLDISEKMGSQLRQYLGKIGLQAHLLVIF